MPDSSLKKFAPPTLKIFAILFFIVAGYFYFLNSIKNNHDRLFDIKETLSWAQSGETVYRVAAKNNVENLLLSRDSWKDYRYSLSIVNPNDCGVIFDYINNENYGFFYFQKETGRIISARLHEGHTEVLQSIPYNSQTLGIVLQKSENTIHLEVNGREVTQLRSKRVSGKVGLLLNTLSKPPVIFHHIEIEGKLADGQPSMEKVSALVSGVMAGTWVNFLPFFFAFLLGIFYFSRILREMPGNSFLARINGFKIPENSKNLSAVLIHVFLAICFFWPFIFKGQVAIFSYDNLGEIFPLFFYAKHNFVNILQGHAPWLWNPLIQNGFPSYSNHWDMIYYPLNWPVFLFSDENLLTALTCKSFLEVAATGILAYGFFNREFKNKRWALFSSVVYQLCSLLIFTMGIFPATSLYFAMTFYLYILWSMPSHRALVNFLLLALAVVLLLTSANVAFIFYACLSLGVISIYRFISEGKAGAKIFVLTALAWLTGALISSVRILSCLQGVMDSNRMIDNFQTIHDRAYMILRLFVPEITGWMGPQSFPVLMSNNLRLIFAQMDLPSNPQNNFFVYFGVLPALLLVLSFLFRADGRHTFWKVYAAVALGIALLWQPLWGILSILCFPLNHYSYHTIILPVGICALIGYTGMAWENEKLQWEHVRRPLLIILGLMVAYIFVFVTYLFPALASLTRIVFLITASCIAAYYFLRHRFPGGAPQFVAFARTGINILVFMLLIVVTIILVLQPFPKKGLVAQGLVLPFLWIAAGAAALLNNYVQEKVGKKLKPGGILISLVLALIGSGILSFSSYGSSIFDRADSLRIYAVDMLIGSLRLFLLLQIAFSLFSGAAKKLFSKRIVFFCLLIFTMGDLIVFNARFNDITAPFYFKQAFYPKGFSYHDVNPELRKHADLVNYRVSHQDQQDMGANKNLVFNMPSYTGTVGYMTKRFSKLLTAFGYPQGIFMLYPEDASSDSRFLDLSAVRYVLADKDRVTERPSALGRLNFLYAAEVIPDEEKTLARLKEETFDPHQTVLLAKSSGIPFTRGDKNAVFIPIGQASPNEVKASFQTDAPGLVLFNESYDAGWKAFLDGSPIPVLLANYNFMACPVVSPGRHEIRLVYAPPAYQRNLYLSCLGLLVFGITGVIALLRRRKR